GRRDTPVCGWAVPHLTSTRSILRGLPLFLPAEVTHAPTHIETCTRQKGKYHPSRGPQAPTRRRGPTATATRTTKLGKNCCRCTAIPVLGGAGGAGAAAATGDADGHLQKAGKKLVNPINTPAVGVKPDLGTRAVNPKKVPNAAFSTLPSFAHCSSPTGANGQGFTVAAASAGRRGAGESTKKGKNDIFYAPVRYVRPTPKERRERIYAYYAAKKLIRETEANSTPSPSEFHTPFFFS
ncbi:hypothetical protein TCSYLVIO_009844, partial [Trypanosoma cruzi]